MKCWGNIEATPGGRLGTFGTLPAVVADTLPVSALVVVVRPRTAAAALLTAIDEVDDDIDSNLFSESCWYWLPLLLYPDEGVDDDE